MAKITEVDDGRDGDATLGKARTRHEEMKELQALADEITEDARDGSGDDEDEDDDGESESEEEIVNGEFVTGPTVWEAAADEEITETHWCVAAARASSSLRRSISSLAPRPASFASTRYHHVSPRNAVRRDDVARGGRRSLDRRAARPRDDLFAR